MDKLVRKLITEWRRLELPFSGERGVVAVSGGADSTALLLALAELRNRNKLTHLFTIAHFNHKLRGKESDADERFVKKLADDNEFEFLSGRGSLKGKSNLEHRAREERYAFLAKVASEKKAAFVLTAHTINDQAETFLLNLIRGSGIDGLRAMATSRPLAEDSDVVLARPMLNWAKREDTEQFCMENAVNFRSDRMNDDLCFTRVKVRKAVLPEMAKLNPKIVETLARCAELLASAAERSNEISAVDPGSDLELSELKRLENGEVNNHLRAWLRARRGNLRGLEMKHIEAVARLANSRKSGRVVELPGGGQVRKGGGRLAFRHIKLEY